MAHRARGCQMTAPFATAILPLRIRANNCKRRGQHVSTQHAYDLCHGLSGLAQPVWAGRCGPRARGRALAGPLSLLLGSVFAIAASVASASGRPAVASEGFTIEETLAVWLKYGTGPRK